MGPNGVSKYYRAPCGARVQIVAACRSIHVMQPNNGMHPTADTLALMNINLAGRRVMPGLGRLLYSF